MLKRAINRLLYKLYMLDKELLGRRTRIALLSSAGLVALVSPLMLWVAWTKAIFFGVLCAGAVALFIVWLLAIWRPDDTLE